jgi:hypothetical protein
MTIRVEDDCISIEGFARIEDAETLLQALETSPAAMVDIAEATRLHLAVVQLLIASGRAIRGVPADPFIRDRLRNLFRLNSG